METPTKSTFEFDEVSEGTILQLITNMKNKNTKGCDQISNKLLKAIKTEIAKPLSFIINQSLKTGSFPVKLKLARVRPLFKKGDPQIINNYRPISILPAISAIFERVIHLQLTHYFEDNTLLTKSQYGYRSGHSTELASLELTDRIYKHLENNEVPIAIFIDLSKAFDTLDHDILLSKLDYYGIKGVAKQLLESYIRNRQQFVQIDNNRSRTITLNIGVPQGSVLGPLLFNIYINDMCKSTKCFDIINYADDTTLITTLSNLKKTNHSYDSSINSEIANINNWLLAQRLCINVSKTKFMMFHMPQKHVPNLNLSINGVNIDKVEEFNFLGLILDTNLKWKPHVQKVATKIRQINGVLNKLKFVFPQRVLRILYTSLIESHINYCLLLWGTNYDQIFKLQKKAMRTISFSHHKAHTSPLFKTMELLNIRDMYNIQLLKLHYKIKNGVIPPYFSNFLSDDLAQRAPVYALRHKRVTVFKPQRDFLRKNAKFQLRELISKFDEHLLQRADNYSMKSYITRIKHYYLEQYQVTCVIENCYVCGLNL